MIIRRLLSLAFLLSLAGCDDCGETRIRLHQVAPGICVVVATAYDSTGGTPQGISVTHVPCPGAPRAEPAPLELPPAYYAPAPGSL